MSKGLIEGRGRPSRHPTRCVYHESESVHEAMQAMAARAGMSFAEAQRIVNRAGLHALQVPVDA